MSDEDKINTPQDKGIVPSSPDSNQARRIVLAVAAFIGGTVIVGILIQKWGADVPDWLLILLCVAFLSLCFYLLWTDKIIKRHRHLIYNHPVMSLAIMTIVGAVLGGGIGALLWWSVYRQRPPTPTTGQRTIITPSIYPDFKKAHERYESQLGEPKKEAEPMRRAYYAKHRKAWAIWLSGRSEVYLLGTDYKWTYLPDLYISKKEKFYYYDEVNRKNLRIPKGEDPPWGTVAKGWAKNPDNWKWIESREWHCDYYGGAIYVQEFKGGLIIGSFPIIPDSDKSANAYVLINEDSKWKAVSSDGKWPPCSPPPTDQHAQEEWEKLHPE